MTRDDSIRQAAEELHGTCACDPVNECYPDCVELWNEEVKETVVILSRHWPKESWPKCPNCGDPLGWTTFPYLHGRAWRVHCTNVRSRCDVPESDQCDSLDAALAAFREQNGECNG